MGHVKLDSILGSYSSRGIDLTSIIRLKIPAMHCKKWLAVFLTPAGMSLTKPSLGGNNLNIPGQLIKSLK
jgi:hypothetical protein